MSCKRYKVIIVKNKLNKKKHFMSILIRKMFLC